MAFYGGLSVEHLRQFVERIERLEEEKQTIAEDIKEVFQEAKSIGFGVKTLKEIIKIRKADASDLEEQNTYLILTSVRLGYCRTKRGRRKC